MSFRFGYNLGNTSPENSIRGATSAATPFVYNRMSVSNWGYYGYIHAAVRAVAHDLYLDGTVFRSSPKYVNKYPVVGEWGYGFGFRYKRSELLFGLALHDQGIHPAGIHAVCGRSPAPAYFLTAAFGIPFINATAACKGQVCC